MSESVLSLDINILRYLLKQYILSGGREEQLYEMYLEAVEGLVNKLLGQTTRSKLYFIGEYRLNSGTLIKEMDHLACYVPGMLALGAEGPHRQSHLKLATRLVETCYFLYRQQPTGLGPERTEFFTDDCWFI